MTEAAIDIEQLKKNAREQLEQVQTSQELEEWRVMYLGRKGAIPLFLRNVKELPAEERGPAGKMGNEVRQELEAAYREKEQAIEKTTPSQKVIHKEADESASIGHLHPLTLAIRRIQHIFSAMGFTIVEGPEVEEVRYAFDDLNIPLEHPARAETDTFYIDPASVPNATGPLLLRQHTSTVQIRSVLEMGLTPPIRIASPGRVFRSERTDATHETTFHQFEALYIDTDVSIADFKAVIETFYSTYFQSEVKTRLRPAFFPFVEPGFEVDMSCVFCEQKGCRVCKYSGWIEVMGAGMVHPNVLRNMNIDPMKYRGFAFGGAVDRLVMLQHNISDIRMFWSGDIRFLKQFS